MSEEIEDVTTLPMVNAATQDVASPPIEEKKTPFDEEITPATDDVEEMIRNVEHGAAITPEMRNKILDQYGRKFEDDQLAPREDISLILDKIIHMSEEDALDILHRAIDYHRDDPNFPAITMHNIKLLVGGAKAVGMEEGDWSFDLKTEAAMIHYHSPYPEVRSVTDPFDDPSIPTETIRAYVLGMSFMAGATALNTFFSPRQPAISIGANVLQLLLAPSGIFMSKVLPDWGVTFRGTRHSLNPGPWSFKEQMLATIMFTVANGAGGVYYVYLVQELPQYLNQKWVKFGYEIILALSTQMFGLGFAGLLRRFVIFPVTSIWPKVLPTLALNRALVLPDKRENRNGWRITRYRFFLFTFTAMFFWFWIPNTLFQALRSFNWMTWIAPNNFPLGMITGFYGGMGFNPWATFDWNVSGSGFLVTPWFSTVQQYGFRVLSGLIIIGMYWGNYYWSAYTPINSNEAFANDGTIYNVTTILDGFGSVNQTAYDAYGPPYFSGANLFGQGAWFAWYPLVMCYVFIRYWSILRKAFREMYRSVRYRLSIWEGNDDAHSRMMKKYKEVPDWWFLVILIISLALGIAAIQNWPTQTPVWVLFAIIGMSAVFLVPSAILVAQANVSMGFNVLFQLLAGVWFPGNPEAQIIVTAFGQNFNSQADNYIADQKLAHYAKVPPRAIFRAQVASVFFNCFIFIGMLNWMVNNFDNGTLCEWDNSQHFVCTDAVLVFASAVEYGAFGVKNFFKLYPILPYTFLMGAVAGTGWAIIQKWGPSWRESARVRWSEEKYARWNHYLFYPVGLLQFFDPAVAWSGALNWTGGNNLSYATNGLYLSFIFMYYIKRHYGPWWEKVSGLQPFS
jgi:OPT family small oligopeptide transporter